MSLPSSNVVSFRLGPEEFQALQTLADRANVTPGAFAKALVLRGIGETEPGGASEVAKLRRDLAVVLESLLVATRALSPTDAKRFVTEKL